MAKSQKKTGQSGAKRKETDTKTADKGKKDTSPHHTPLPFHLSRKQNTQ